MKLPKLFGKKEPGTAVAVAPKKPGLVRTFADRYEVDADKLMTTLKMTAFKQDSGDVTNEQMLALLVVANEYQLNPFTKEIYAFPNKGTIVPIVSIDGWLRITNSHPQFDGMEIEDNFDGSGKIDSVTCKIYRKDRKMPTVVTEYLSECKKETGPWKKWPARMLRHKAVIQCARYAFGFSGIYEPDEADRIMESTESRVSEAVQSQEAAPEQFPAYPDDKFEKMFPGFEKAIKAGTKSASAMISTIQTKYTLSAEQIKQIEGCEAIEGEIIEAKDESRCTSCGHELNNEGACTNCGASQTEQ